MASGAVFGLGMGFGFPALMALIGDLAEGPLRPRVSALFWLFYSACFFVSPVLPHSVPAFLGYDGALRLWPAALRRPAPAAPSPEPQEPRPMSKGLGAPSPSSYPRSSAYQLSSVRWMISSWVRPLSSAK